jgi:metal-responsive CopG/Arc/MetJ family transcriptional regulator
MKQSNVIKKSVSFPPELVEKVKKYSEKRKRSFSAQVSLWVEEKLKEAELLQNPKQAE